MTEAIRNARTRIINLVYNARRHHSEATGDIAYKTWQPIASQLEIESLIPHYRSHRCHPVLRRPCSPWPADGAHVWNRRPGAGRASVARALRHVAPLAADPIAPSKASKHFLPALFLR